MNYKIQKLPESTNTLDFENINAPYIVADKNQYFLDKHAEKLRNFTEELRIYTDKDELTIVSNGIKNFFEVDLSSMRVLFDGNMRIVADRYVKDDTPVDELVFSTPLNMIETVDYLKNIGYFSKVNTYTELLSKNDLRLSNMLSIFEVSEICISKEISTVEVISPYVNNSDTSDGMIFSRKTAEDTLIHKTKETEKVSVTNDNVTIASFGDVLAYSMSFESNYIPSADKDIVSKNYMQSGAYGLEGSMRAPVYIDNVEGADTPITKEKTIELLGTYISKIDKEINNIIIKRDSDTLDDNFIMSSSEVSEYIDDYFLKLTDPSIDNIDEFEAYLTSLCKYDDNFLEYDMSIEGGKIYLGFDYDNMSSIFNSSAISSILFDTKGSYSTTMGKTFNSARYFRTPIQIDRLAAYGQSLGYPFDISIDTLAQVFSAIKGIVYKLCILTPDVIPVGEIIEIPTFSPVTIAVPPIFTSFSVAGIYIAPFLSVPYYMPPFKFFIISQPSFHTFISRMESFYLTVPRYQPDFVFSISIPPVFSTHFNTGVATPFLRDGLQDPSSLLSFYSHTDGRVESMIFFESIDYCLQRFRAVSYRSFNMIDVSAIFTAIISNLGNYFFYSKKTSKVMSAPQMAGLFLGDVSCRVAESIGSIPVNVDISKMFDTAKVDENGGIIEEDGNIDTCLVTRSGDMTDSVGQDAAAIENTVFRLNGITLAGNGDVFGTALIEHTEWFNKLSSVSIDSWLEYNSSEYLSIVDAVASLVSNGINDYANGRRINDWANISSSPFITSGFSYITTNVEGRGHAMAEYMELENSRIASFKFSAMADPMGITKSSVDAVGITAPVLLYPYDNVVIGSTDFNPGPWEDYIADPPPPLPGSNKVYIWKPLENALNENIYNVRYLGLSDDPESVFSVYGPVVLVSEPEPGVFTHDQIGTETVASTITLFGETYHTLEAEGNTVVLGDTRYTGASEPSAYDRAYCDPWLSPNEIYAFNGQAGDGDGTVDPILGGGFGGDDTELIIENRIVSVTGGCGDNCDKRSGIDPADISSISEAWSIDPNDLSQIPGDVPGTLALTLTAKLTKYVSEMSSETNLLTDVVYSANTKVCLTFGAIDGFANEDGDILAQGMSEDQILEAAEGGNEPNITYLGPTCAFAEFTTLERKLIGTKNASVYTFDISAMIAAIAMDVSGEEPVPFVNFVDYSTPNKDIKQAEVRLMGDIPNQEENSPYQKVMIGELATPGIVFSYKHAGANPEYPVVTGYSGASEVNLFDGTKLTATIVAPVPNTVYTYREDATDMIEASNITEGDVHFYINIHTIQVVIPDRYAMLSSKRTVKVVWKEDVPPPPPPPTQE